MSQINVELINGVKAFLDNGDRSFLNLLKEMDRNDIQGQATVRYLMQLKHWPFTPDSDFAELLTHFFAAFPERKAMEPEVYQKTTFDLIKDAWDYECVAVVPEPREPKVEKPKATKRSTKPAMMSESSSDEEGESGSKTFKSINQAETEA